MAWFMTTPAVTLPRRRLLLAATGAAWLLHPLTTLAAAPSEAEQFIATLGERTVRVLDRPGSDQAYDDIFKEADEGEDVQ